MSESIHHFADRCASAVPVGVVPDVTEDTDRAMSGPVVCVWRGWTIALVLTDHVGQDANGVDLYGGALLVSQGATKGQIATVRGACALAAHDRAIMQARYDADAGE